MSVYVDDLFPTQPKANWPYARACHMFGDVAELHEMAGLIGLSRNWFQAKPAFPHYDLTAYKRQQAIARGAIPVDREFAVNFRRGLREAIKGEARGSE
jgi:hypothetical protein